MNWEYRSELFHMEWEMRPKYKEIIRELGDDGWELASTIPVQWGSGKLERFMMIFKRPK